MARGHGQVFSDGITMARANTARRQGDDFQARLFWLRAACLLDPVSPVIKVGYEIGPKSFDDIWVEYDPAKAPLDHEGHPINRRHIQCKWHTAAGAFGHDDLIDPGFINAEKFSLLQKAYQAQTRYASDGIGSRFELLTNWRIKHDDALIELVAKESDAINLAKLFDGTTTDASRMGKVRKMWREHLATDHTGLQRVARTLAIVEDTMSLSGLRERLDERFAAVGMQRVPAGETGFIYDDLIVKLAGQGRLEFDRDGFLDMCRRENLLDPRDTPRTTLTIGVRSFMHPIDNLEERCTRSLNLVPYFEGRYIRNPDDWQSKIYPALQTFLTQEARSVDHVALVLDAHTSLAFCAGSILNVKSGKRVEIEQRSNGRRFWSADDAPHDPAWPRLFFEDIPLHQSGPEIAIAIGLTHDITAQVKAFATAHMPDVRSVFIARPQAGPSQFSVCGGRHAWQMSEAVTHRLRDAGASRVHIFMAAPNAFSFFLGQHQKALGPVTLYEWDFDGLRSGGYNMSLTVGGS
jgi:hypothetical protein